MTWNTEDEAYQFYNTSTRIIANGGFHLRKFVTNSVSLQQRQEYRMTEEYSCSHMNVLINTHDNENSCVIWVEKNL